MRSRVAYALLAVLGVAALALVAGYASLALSFGGSPAVWTLEAERVPPDRVAEATTANYSSREEHVVARVLENGSAETVGYTLDLNGTYAERNGTYYRLSTEFGGERAVTRHVASFEAVNDTDRTVTDYESLPDPDRRPLGRAYKASVVREREDCANRSCPPMEYVYDLPWEANESAVGGGEVEYVRFQNVTFRVTVSGW